MKQQQPQQPKTDLPSDQKTEPAAEQPSARRQFSVEAVLREAELAGVDNLSALRTMLERTDPLIAEVQERIAEARAKRAVRYYVQGPGAVRLGGKNYDRGAEIMLTKAEARELGALVAEHEPPPPPTPTGERVAGMYRLLGPGAIKQGGTFHYPGSEVYLTAEEARTMPVDLQLLAAE